MGGWWESGSRTGSDSGKSRVEFIHRFGIINDTARSYLLDRRTAPHPPLAIAIPTLNIQYLAYKCLNHAYGAGVVQYLSSKTYPFIR